jgi:membrane-associated phospholipid phosphatase
MKLLNDVFAGSVRLAVVLLVAAPLAFGQTESAGSPYQLRLKSDLTVMAVAGGAALIPLLLDDHVEKSCPCRASEVNGLDRGTAGSRSDSIDQVSDFAVAAALALPATMMFVDSKSGGGVLQDSVVMAEAVLVNLALNQMIKVAVQRPRPLIYELEEDEPELNKNDNYLSFYSQHTSVAFAAGMSFARTFALRHPESPRRWLVYATVIASGATVGTMRVLAGRHFPTDVITGAVAGGAIGMFVPWFHQKRDSVSISFSPLPSGAKLSLRLPIG